MSSLKYRADIDGLRTLAVVPVILFHAGASWLPGGFVGVDIFFVISGYLISAIILREVQAGQFSFLSFYERRLRRIIPALLVMVLATVFLFQIIALPDQAKSAAESGIAALLSVSNFYFWGESGYFAPASEFMPLLHTWSLAVEEQFYLIFPVILIALWKFRLPIRWALGLGLLVAFFVGLWLSWNKPSVAYYLLPARAWELAIGAVIAAGAVPAIRWEILRQIVSALGVGMILYSLVYVRSDMIFPGWVAIIPCVGAAMVIHAGGETWIARRVLASRLFVLIGLMSYSLYLWHWPVLAAFRIGSASIHLDSWVTALAIVATFVLAWLSWRYVERPFRDRKKLSAGRMLGLLGGGAVTTLVVAILSITTNGFPSRLEEPARIALAASQDVDPLRVPCQGLASRAGCRFGNIDSPVSYAIVGDSHAAAIRPAVEASGIMGDAGGTLYWMGACPMLDDAHLQNHPDKAKCAEFKSSVWAAIKADENIDTIILAGRWSFQMTGWMPESGGSNRTWLLDKESLTPSIEENSKVLARSLDRTLDRLSALGLKVIVVGAVPEPGFDVPRTVALARHSGLEVPRGILRTTVEARAGLTDAFLSGILQGREEVRFVSIWEAFCGSAWCDIERNGVPIYYDDDHLSHAGAVMVAAPALIKAY